DPLRDCAGAFTGAGTDRHMPGYLFEIAKRPWERSRSAYAAAMEIPYQTIALRGIFGEARKPEVNRAAFRDRHNGRELRGILQNGRYPFRRRNALGTNVVD